MAPSRLRWPARLCRLAVVATGLALFFFLASSVPTLRLPLTPYRLETGPVGLVMVALGIVLCFTPAKLTLAATWTLTLIAGLFVVAYRPPERGDQLVDVEAIRAEPEKPRAKRTWATKEDWFDEIWDLDPVLATRIRAGVVGQEHHRDFDCVYTIDADGCRATPQPQNPDAPRVAFLGCSFTFGTGVADQETFASILAKEAWPGIAVKNLGTSGWGTTHARLRFKEILSEPRRPTAIVYFAIAAHLQRNFRRRSWANKVNTSLPLFEWENGKLVHKGLIPPSEANWDDGPKVIEQERSITTTLLNEMVDEANQAGVPFLVAMLYDTKLDPDQRAMADAIAASRAPFLDFRDALIDFFPIDYHPTPLGHRLVARAIAGSKAFAEALRMPELHKPESVSLGNVSWNGWRRRYQTVDTRDAIRPLGDPKGFRLERVYADQNQKFHPHLMLPFFRLDTSAAIRCRFKVRSDEPRDLHVDWQREVPTLEYVSPGQVVKCGREWTSADLTFRLKDASSWLSLRMIPQSNTSPVEVADLEVTRDGHAVSPTLDFHAWRPGALNRLIGETGAPDRPRPKTARAFSRE